MKIDIKQKLSIEKLNMFIEQYMNTMNFSKDTYLIMNSKTMDNIARQDILNSYGFCPSYKGRDVYLYRGIKVAYTNALEYGEVEIR